jgi:hypothetical protein
MVKAIPMIFLFDEALEPLYMILCIMLLIAVPLVPAWLLYKIAPKEKFLANGNFSGFQINATGAAAIYIVLFVATYPKIDGILKSLNDDAKTALHNQITVLKNQNTDLLERFPWKVQCTLKLFDENDTEIANDAYYTCLNPKIIQEYPNPVQINANSKTLTFYVDNSDMQTDSTNCTLVFLSGDYGSTNVPILKSKAKNNKEIYLTTSFRKQSNKESLGKSTASLLQKYDSSQGLKTLPIVR